MRIWLYRFNASVVEFQQGLFPVGKQLQFTAKHCLSLLNSRWMNLHLIIHFFTKIWFFFYIYWIICLFIWIKCNKIFWTKLKFVLSWIFNGQNSLLLSHYKICILSTCIRVFLLLILLLIHLIFISSGDPPSLWI